jgi:hypothetical protein
LTSRGCPPPTGVIRQQRPSAAVRPASEDPALVKYVCRRSALRSLQLERRFALECLNVSHSSICLRCADMDQFELAQVELDRGNQARNVLLMNISRWQAVALSVSDVARSTRRGRAKQYCLPFARLSRDAKGQHKWTSIRAHRTLGTLTHDTMIWDLNYSIGGRSIHTVENSNSELGDRATNTRHWPPVNDVLSQRGPLRKLKAHGLDLLSSLEARR